MTNRVIYGFPMHMEDIKNENGGREMKLVGGAETVFNKDVRHNVTCVYSKLSEIVAVDSTAMIQMTLSTSDLSDTICIKLYENDTVLDTQNCVAKCKGCAMSYNVKTLFRAGCIYKLTFTCNNDTILHIYNLCIICEF